MTLLGWLTVLFVGLKLTGIIDWAWWIVVWPLYPWILSIATMLLVGFIAGVVGEMERRR